MTSKKNKARGSKPENVKKFKKKTSILVTEKVEYVDYKDVNLLTRFVSDRSKIRNRRVTGNSVQQQRDIANAVKIAREMALIPYAKRVAQSRPGRGRGDSGRDGAEQHTQNRNEETVEAVDAAETTDVQETEA